MQKLGKNLGSYNGEAIDIGSVLSDIRQSARKAGWVFESIQAAPGLELQSWRRPSAQLRKRIYISAGIHGDEPAGPLAARQLVEENLWPPDVEIVLFPCLNPTGFPLNRRENAQEIDLNRQ